MIERLTAPEFTNLFSCFTIMVVTLTEKITTAYAQCRDLTDAEVLELKTAAKEASEEITAGYIAALERHGEEISQEEAEIFKAQIVDALLHEIKAMIDKATEEMKKNSEEYTVSDDQNVIRGLA